MTFHEFLMKLITNVFNLHRLAPKPNGYSSPIVVFVTPDAEGPYYGLEDMVDYLVPDDYPSSTDHNEEACIRIGKSVKGNSVIFTGLNFIETFASFMESWDMGDTQFLVKDTENNVYRIVDTTVNTELLTVMFHLEPLGKL